MNRMESTAFCINCDCRRKYKKEIEEVTVTVRGLCFSYAETKAVCENCNEELYVPEINDINVQARENAYREVAGLITVDEIKLIMKKYDIGASPLSQLLGFGDVTITRYLNGQLPSKKNSDKLLDIEHSHKLMEQYLKENSDKITPIAYKKCEKALQKVDELYSTKKIEVVIRYFLRKMSEITPLALQKMLYYAQAFYFSFYNKELFTDCCQAWIHGPVYPEVYQKYKMYGYNPIDTPTLEPENENDELQLGEIELLDSIVESFGCYSGPVLEKMTHSEEPWEKARDGLSPQERSEIEISREDIYDYFRDIRKKYDIMELDDIRKYSRIMAEKIINKK